MNKRELANAKWHSFAKQHIFWDEFNMLYLHSRVYGWSVRKTARDLGVPKSTLHDRLKKHGLVELQCKVAIGGRKHARQWGPRR